MKSKNTKAEAAPAQAGSWKVTEELDSIQCPICKGFNRLSVSSDKTHVYCAECGDRITEAYLQTQGFTLEVALEREGRIAPARSGQYMCDATRFAPLQAIYIEDEGWQVCSPGVIELRLCAPGQLRGKDFTNILDRLTQATAKARAA